ncbi:MULTISPECIES: DUF2147 domain-containing protein [unclassified Rhizobium]|uniref:DUF2147 domain-containing protein n=1 Tax=unclassified Rhizobium TaxID=2613769 RepID=UPI000715938A|nr:MULTISPECIES: DUF2147 domain-containing protein [unclassified Rhizobium]KQS96527.1 hypothetical protein ASG50_05645 [Rhizobium sp. Leaf386]KQT06366.1 hypothetical protein ASG42_01890 [Rhizobium sp. Leaf391]KQT92436.1 hypothetical protein ASG68_16645 [Rhizobium sp. Leaf453]
MIRTFILAAAMTLATAGTGFSAEPIVGNWKTASGETAAISSCGGGYCITLKTGKHAGKRIGSMKGSGNDYSGEITDPANDKTYSGNASISGSSLKMQGCVLKVLCKSQTWTRM